MENKQKLTCDKKGQAHPEKPVTTIRSPSSTVKIPITMKHLKAINNNSKCENGVQQTETTNNIILNNGSSDNNNDEIDGDKKSDCNDGNGAEDDENEAVKCIFLCEFHATAGPKIATQVPENYISKELFDTVNRYIIPKLQLQRSFLSV